MESPATGSGTPSSRPLRRPLQTLSVLLLACRLIPLAAAAAAAGRRGRGAAGWSHPTDDGADGPSSGAAAQDLVTSLPGQPVVAFEHYAGYVTVHEQNGRALFYWFFEASSAADAKPLVLWLNGGPGCSSVGYGATEEIGPFLLDAVSRELVLNPYAWNDEANLLFLESPVGVGFSYSNTTGDYQQLDDDFAANDTYAFLHKWFEKFPAYRNRTLYLAGESYAGKYVPELAQLIHDRNGVDPALSIDLKGFLLGNPVTSSGHDWQGLVDYAWSHAVVSDETHDIIAKNCDFFSNTTFDNELCRKAVDEVLIQYGKIDIYNLYTPVCTKNNHTGTANPASLQFFFRSSSAEVTRMPWVAGGYDPCIDDYVTSFYNRLDVQKALHVNDGGKPKNWTICNMDIYQNWKKSLPSVLPIYKKLVDAGLRIWVFSGDTDGRVPVLSTRYCLNALGLPKAGPWRPWYHQGQVAGWVQEYKGLTFATFRGAGHAVPTFKPSESAAFFASFLAGRPPPFEP